LFHKRKRKQNRGNILLTTDSYKKVEKTRATGRGKRELGSSGRKYINICSYIPKTYRWRICATTEGKYGTAYFEDAYL